MSCFIVPPFRISHKLPPERGEEEGVYTGGITLREVDRGVLCVNFTKHLPDAAAQELSWIGVLY